jgi:hypothetical protein
VKCAALSVHRLTRLTGPFGSLRLPPLIRHAFGRNVVRRSSVFVLLAACAVLLGGGFRSSLPPVGPGGTIGAMTLASGIEQKADSEIWLFCRPDIPKPGRYLRTCSVPRVQRLFIGYGDWERTRKAVDSVWKQLTWDLWFDGRRVSLSRFGTSYRTLYAFPAAGGKNVILREWNVNLIGVTRGRHVIRYRSASRSVGTTDATWTFTVG